MDLDLDAEWLEADGRGGFASGTVGGIRTRRYHALLLAATRPPAGRMVLVNGLECRVRTASGEHPLSTHRYAPDVIHPDARPAIAAFDAAPWPTWTFRLPDGAEIAHEALIDHAGGDTILRWRRTAGDGPCTLTARPLLSGRDYHALHHENPAFGFDGASDGGCVVWSPYPGVPSVAAATNGAWRAAPDWYRNFLYSAERDRGLDCVEDLASPGVFTWDLGRGPALMRLRATDGRDPPAFDADETERAMAAERARRRRLSADERSAQAYVVARQGGRTIVAGYPWFTDWGRDTFVALRGLLLATGRVEEAGDILRAWAGHVSRGMLPNRFPDDGAAPEYNSVDASLWFVVAADADGLLRAGEPGVQLTWMDAKLGDWVVTPRTGKPVEVQALWINALRIGAAWDPRWAKTAARAAASFAARFPDPDTGGLHDVVDADGVPGAVDRRIRPNQIFAVGGLPFPLLSGEAASRVVDLVERELLTPMGLRTLSPRDPDYVGRYAGDPRHRDGAYHQGTAWPWLLGPFVEAWLRTRNGEPDARDVATARFVAPLRAHMRTAGLGHVSEVADGDAPHAPGGCPFQAWSLGELLRLERLLR